MPSVRHYPPPGRVPTPHEPPSSPPGPPRPGAAAPRMTLHRLLQARAAQGKPVRAGLIGAGKFGSMYLSQARRTPGLQILAVAGLAPDRARAALARTGWEPGRYAARSLE